MTSSIDTQLVKTAIAQLKKYFDLESSIEILAYCQTIDNSTELLITNTSTIPEGSRGDFISRFFLLVNQGNQWELTKELNDDELTDWVLKNDKEITVVSNEFYLILISKLCNWEQA